MRRLLTALLALGVLASLAAVPASASSATVTGDVPNRRGHSATVLRTSTADGPVQVNVDIGMKVRAGTRCLSSLPGACSGGVYHPCFNLHDPAYAACRTYTLYEVIGPGADLAAGITIPAATRARNGKLVQHGWGGRTTEVHLEIYSRDPLERFGDARLRVDSFPEVVGATAFSKPIGHLRLPLRGAPDTGVIFGRAVGENGKALGPASFKLDAFGHRDTGHRTGLLHGESYQMTGFGGAAIQPFALDGAFSTGPLWRGSYDVHVQRRGQGWSCAVKVKAADVRFDLDFRRKDLGRGCRSIRALVQGVPG